MTIVETAPAKLNLALHVRARRDDGYHELETLFAFVRDGDRLTLDPATDDSLAIDGPFAAGLSTGDDNLVSRARAAFRATFGDGPRYAVRLWKALPVASGIGGGSADAAAMLRAMARATGVPTTDPALFAVAATLGADVPACLLGRTAIGAGRGEALTPVAGLPGMPCLLVNPAVPVSTAAVFARWDGVDRGALPTGDAGAIMLDGRNDLEPPARAVAPAIDDALAWLAERPGVRVRRMSGSGATCFAMFDAPASRSAAAQALRQDRPGWWAMETELA